jgi:cytoskeletal protein CcmA (bactofilin family)
MNGLLRTGGTGGGEAWRDVSVSLGSDAEVSGRLSFSGPTRIEGRLKGEVRSADLLVVGPQAVVQATVHAGVLVVLGQIHGDVVDAQRVEIRPGGLIVGNISTRALVITEGGRFEGNCQMSGKPTVED